MGLIENTQQEYYDGNDFGNYQFVSLQDIINQFMLVYVGEDKIIPKAKRLDVAFHAQRALAELSFDTLKSCKAQEITVPPSLQMILPQDYVNYTKISWVDSAGIKHLLYPTSKTSNPKKYQIDADSEYLFNEDGSVIPHGNLITNGNFHGGSNGWDLNVSGSTTTAQGTSLSTATSTLGDPETGWFYEENSIKGYALPLFQAFKQLNVDIRGGEEYTVTYTISNYVTGIYNFVIVDENGDRSSGIQRSANGTYTETITTSQTADSYPASSLYFQSRADNTSTSGLNVVIDNISLVRVGYENLSTSWENYKSVTPSENQDDYQDDTYWPMDGSRFGLDPQHAQANGSFYIDCISGKIHFSSNISGKTVILDYISDSLGTDGEMQVHKFAEEAMYKWISHAILSGKANIPEYQVNRLKKERFAAIRTAKLRLSNLKVEELTQILRGKSKQIKH